MNRQTLDSECVSLTNINLWNIKKVSKFSHFEHTTTKIIRREYIHTYTWMHVQGYNDAKSKTYLQLKY